MHFRLRLKHMERTRWIVVGSDFSEGAARAIEHAIKLAAESAASVACVHAYEDAPGASALVDPAPTLRDSLADAIARLGRTDVHVPVCQRRAHDPLLAGRRVHQQEDRQC